MVYELQYFDLFIFQYLPSLSGQLPPERFEEQRRLLVEETAGVRSRMVAQVFSFERQSGIEIYIQQHQSAVIALADAVLKFIDKQHVNSIYKLSKTNPFVSLCKLCYRSLEDILFFIEHYFSKYFNQDCRLPEVHRLIATRELGEKIPILEQALVERGVSEDVVEAALSPMRRFLGGNGEDVSYRRVIWLKELVSELEQLTMQPQGLESEIDEGLLNALWYLNLNSFKFYQYCVMRYTRLIELEDGDAAKTERISWLLKRLNQLQQKPCFALCRNRPSIKDMLCYWLNEELRHLDQKQEVAIVSPPDKAIKPFKVGTTIPVSQLAYLLRLMVETGLVSGQNLSELIRFFSEHFTSLRTERISPVSFRMKYYNTDRTTAAAVRDMLLRMANYSKKLIA